MCPVAFLIRTAESCHTDMPQQSLSGANFSKLSRDGGNGSFSGCFWKEPHLGNAGPALRLLGQLLPGVITGRETVIVANRTHPAEQGYCRVRLEMTVQLSGLI